MKMFVLALLLCSACSTATPPPPAASATRTSVDGTFASFTTTPRGDVDGVVLQDGTIAHFPPHTFVGTNAKLAIGDKVQIEGDAVDNGSPRTLGRATVKKGDVLIAADDGRAPPAPRDGVLTPPPPRPAMPAVTRDGTIARVLVNPHGDTDGLVLDDSSVVRFPPSVNAKLATGGKVHIVGTGTSQFVEADSIALGSGETLALGPASAPPPPPTPTPLATVTDSGTIAQLLQNPEGAPDIIVLSTGTLVRIPPPMRDAGTDALKVGAPVQVEGEGGTYAGTKSIHARRLVVAGRELVDRGPVAAPPPPPAVAP